MASRQKEFFNEASNKRRASVFSDKDAEKDDSRKRLIVILLMVLLGCALVAGIIAAVVLTYANDNEDECKLLSNVFE